MKKIIIFALLFVMAGISVVLAADWSQYESGRDNIRLDGYQGQPGYIALTDGSGTVLGYLWMGANGKLKWCTRAAIDLTTTKLTDTVGVNVDAED